MEVIKEHHVDCGERDEAGFYEYYYAYWLYSFWAGGLMLVARSYDDQPQQAHFLRREEAGVKGILNEQDIASPLFTAACDHLRRVEGKAMIAVLKSCGYEGVTAASSA